MTLRPRRAWRRARSGLGAPWWATGGCRPQRSSGRVGRETIVTVSAEEHQSYGERTSGGLVLDVQHVGKQFGGLQALHDVTLQLRQGEIVGLVGANGAGKSTLLNCIAGAIKSDEGRVTFAGHDVTGLSPERRCRLGISRTFQLPRPFPNLTALETVMVATWAGRRGRSRRAAVIAATEALALARVRNRPDAPASELTTGDLRRLDLARALATSPRLLLLDEIGAGSTATELDELFDVVLQLRASGMTVILVEHILHAIGSLCDRVALLDHGQVLLDGPTAEVVADPLFSAHYLGITTP